MLFLSTFRRATQIGTEGVDSFVSVVTSQSGVENEYFAIILISCALGSLGLARGGFSINHLDICDAHHAGLVISLVNVSGTIGGVIGVPLTGRLLEYGGGANSSTAWAYAFSLSAVLCGFGALIFQFFAEGRKVIFSESECKQETVALE